MQKTGKIGIVDTGLSPNFQRIHGLEKRYSDFGSLAPAHGEKVVLSMLAVDPFADLEIAGASLKDWERVEKSLLYLKEKNLSILSLSWACSELPYSILKCLKDIQAQGVEILCAYSSSLPYPWSLFHGVGNPNGFPSPPLPPNFPSSGSSFLCGVFSSLFGRYLKENPNGNLNSFLEQWKPEETKFYPSKYVRTGKQTNLKL